MKFSEFLKKYWTWAALFALLNVVMYFVYQTYLGKPPVPNFWIGGSSFLPMIGILGKDGSIAFLAAFIVNIGVIVGALIGALSSGEFKLRMPTKENWWKGVVGGTMIGVGVTLAPGTCTTAFVTGIPFLSVSSFLSAAGIVLGGFIMYKILYRGV